MPEIIYEQWYSQQSRSRYPFMDTATMVSRDNDILPDDLFYDLVLYPIGNSSTDMYLSNIEVVSGGAVLTVATSLGAVCTATFATASLGSDVYELSFYDAYDRPAGEGVCSPTALATIASWLSGNHEFSRAAAGFCPSIVLPTPEAGLRGVVTADGTVFSGDVVIVAGEGIRVEITEEGYVRFDAVGDPLFMRKLCEDEGGEHDPGPFLQTINGIAADESGQFIIYPGDNLAEDTVIRILPDTNGLRVYMAATQGFEGG